jgi:adenosylcobyric acid synthase
MNARALMLQGTGSDVGKSLMVAGLARALVNRGLKVLPFKPQNMSNNAAVTADGGEIGRAQALQARAARVPASVHMNPVLLKPQSERGAQIIVQGKVWNNASAQEYQQIKHDLMPYVLESFMRLKAQADIVLVEGAGSASEINLRQNDIANMGFARAADVPVVVVGDIDRGGVIASLVGTYYVLAEADRHMIGGFIINKFRGDSALFHGAMADIETRTGWQQLGLVPYFTNAHHLPKEDAFGLKNRPASRKASRRCLIAVPVLPHISNFDDLDPLEAEPLVELVLVHKGDVIPRETDLIILPGSKSTIADLAALRAAGFDVDIAAHVRHGGKMLGICGGYQMLGQTISDPDGVEGLPSQVQGLGLLNVDTLLTGTKRLQEVEGIAFNGAPLHGYEMHMGQTIPRHPVHPFAVLGSGQQDGACSADGRVMGTYIHGLFTHDAQRNAWLELLTGQAGELSYDRLIDETLNELADHLEQHININDVLALAR